MEIFLELYGKMFEGWCRICDFFAGYTVDALEAFVLFMVFFPFIAAVIAGGVKYWWNLRQHKQFLLLFFYIAGYVPTLVVFTISVLIENKEPLVKGTRRKMRRFTALVADFISRVK